MARKERQYEQIQQMEEQVTDCADTAIEDTVTPTPLQAPANNDVLSDTIGTQAETSGLLPPTGTTVRESDTETPIGGGDEGPSAVSCFASRSLNPAEQKYTITELETLGLVWAVKLLRPYILGHRCIVVTDHAACTSLLTAKNPSSKLVRWAMSIQELDLDICHRSGKSNQVQMHCQGTL